MSDDRYLTFALGKGRLAKKTGCTENGKIRNIFMQR